MKSIIDEIYSDIDLISYTLETILDDSSNDDEKLLIEMSELHKSATSRLEKLSFTQLFQGENDDANAYIDIQSGSGGTEAQDWVAMIMRMYLKWIEKHSFTLKSQKPVRARSQDLKMSRLKLMEITLMVGLEQKQEYIV